MCAGDCALHKCRQQPLHFGPTESNPVLPLCITRSLNEEDDSDSELGHEYEDVDADFLDSLLAGMDEPGRHKCADISQSKDCSILSHLWGFLLQKLSGWLDPTAKLSIMPFNIICCRPSQSSLCDPHRLLGL